MLGIRTKFGAFPVPMRETLRHMVRRKDITRSIAMVSDQTPPGGEIQYWTRFLNQDTPFFVGADKLARRLDLTVLFVGMRKIKRGYYEIYFEEIGKPPYKDFPENAIIESYDAHTAMSTQALNSPIVLRGILDVLLNHSGLYEKLRGRNQLSSGDRA